MTQDTKSDQVIDREQVFMLFAIFCGDLLRTAHALDIPVEVVAGMATELEWDRKLAPIIELKNSTRPGDVERALNRARNFVSAHRLCIFLERVLRMFGDMSPTDLQCFIFPQEIDKRTQKVYQTCTTRALADLAAAFEKAQQMTYAALNDTPVERKERSEDGGDADATAAEIHLRMAAAMQAAGGGSKTMKGHLLDAQLQIAQEFSRVELEMVKPAS